VLKSICIAERQTKVFKTKAVVKQRLKAKVLKFILVLHLDLNYFRLFNVFKSDAVFRKVDMCDRMVVF